MTTCSELGAQVTSRTERNGLGTQEVESLSYVGVKGLCAVELERRLSKTFCDTMARPRETLSPCYDEPSDPVLRVGLLQDPWYYDSRRSLSVVDRWQGSLRKLNEKVRMCWVSGITRNMCWRLALSWMPRSEQVPIISYIHPIHVHLPLERRVLVCGFVPFCSR